MTWSPIGIYRAHDTVLHRIRPGAKLLTLIALSIGLMVIRTPLTTAIALVTVLALATIGRVHWRDLLRMLRGFAILGTVLFAFHVWQNDVWHAFTIVGTLVALILAATVVTATTHTDEMIETITWALRPLRIVGVRSERIALTFSLTLRAIPAIFDIARETRDAAKARGLERNPRVYLTPLVIRSIAHARALGEALHARGLDDS